VRHWAGAVVTKCPPDAGSRVRVCLAPDKPRSRGDDQSIDVMQETRIDEIFVVSIFLATIQDYPGQSILLLRAIPNSRSALTSPFDSGGPPTFYPPSYTPGLIPNISDAGSSIEVH